MPNNYRAYP